jgi:hypothetical protein
MLADMSAPADLGDLVSNALSPAVSGLSSIPNALGVPPLAFSLEQGLPPLAAVPQPQIPMPLPPAESILNQVLDFLRTQQGT